jgi:molybdate transport system substrate-binding protein
VALLVLLVLLMLSLAACGTGGRASARAPTTSRSLSLSGTVRVFAASSLTETFRELAHTFEADNKAVHVELNLASSSALAQQIAAGAPADVVATADEVTMKAITDARHSQTAPKLFARNRLVLVVEKGNPKSIAALSDLAKPGIVFVLCAPGVPCGRLGALALLRAGVTAKPASLEENVKGVVSKVALGEADAGIAYATDAKASAKDVDAVAIAGSDAGDLEARYPIAVVKGATNAPAASAWIALVTSARGQRMLAKYGFRSP